MKAVSLWNIVIGNIPVKHKLLGIDAESIDEAAMKLSICIDMAVTRRSHVTNM